MFEQSLSGLIKALRASKTNEDAVIETALAEIAAEVKSADWDIKAGAILKLTYLEMLGHSHLAQYSFQVIECMACSKYHIKQIGYLAASQSFAQATEVLLLTNNLIKKDLSTAAATPTSILLTLSSLPPLLNTSQQLSSDLEPELLRQLTNSRPQVRRSAVLVLGSLWRSHPSEDGSLSDTIINKLADRLLDDDPGVVGAAVNVMLELARTCVTDEQKEPFLRLAPECFELLTTSNNNWMLIKIIKLFALLTPVEPRLVKKLLPPLTNLISTTPAMSLLYECIHAVIAGNMLQDNEPLAKMCVNKLSSFLHDSDQNLRYIALLALTKMLPTHPYLLTAHSSMILKCIDDADTSIRTRALNLMEGMVDRNNLTVIIRKLMQQLSPAPPSAVTALNNVTVGGATAISSITSPSYRTTLIQAILRMTTFQIYANISNFEWFVDLLISLAGIAVTLPSNAQVEEDLVHRISAVLIDVCARVRAIRPYVVQQSIATLLPSNLMLDASAWIVGEYSTDFRSAAQWRVAIDALVQAGCLYAAVKVFARWCHALAQTGEWSEMEHVLSTAAFLSQHEAPEQEMSQLLRIMLSDLQKHGAQTSRTPKRHSDTDDANPFAETEGEEDVDDSGLPASLEFLSSVLFPYELNPVNEKAQGMVNCPDELDLDSWINPGSIASLSVESAMHTNGDVDEYGRPRGGFPATMAGGYTEMLAEPVKKSKKSKTKEGKSSEKSKKRKKKQALLDADDVDAIPIVKLDLDTLPSLDRRQEPQPVPMFVDVEGELPPSVPSSRSRTHTPQVPTPPDTAPPPSASRPEGDTTMSAQMEQVEEPVPVVVKKVKKAKKASKSRSPHVTQEDA